MWNNGNRDRPIFLASKITEDGDCSHQIERNSLIWRKVMTNLNGILKSRDNTLPTKVYIVKTMIFPVVMYGCESRTKESLAPKNWCFWTVVLEKTLESPLDWKIKLVIPKRHQPWILIGRTDAEAEAPSSNTLATWCEEPPHWKRPWCWKRLRTRGKGGDRGWDGWMASLIQWTWVWASSER